jgi:NhaA family Na+:H+ antiporter
MPSTLSSKSVRERIVHFMHLEASGGLVLMFVALLALLANNSFMASGYQGILDTPVAVQLGDFKIAKPALLWINDGLMAIFFFLVGLEIKREVLKGELSSLSKISLPLFAAFGGIFVPALVYLSFNYTDPTTAQGWAIPAAFWLC